MASIFKLKQEYSLHSVEKAYNVSFRSDMLEPALTSYW